MAGITFDPYKTQGISSGYNVDSTGYTQGDAQDDPAVRLQLSSGVVASDAAMWPGMGILELTPASNDKVRGSKINNATATTCSGFTVSNQAFHGIITPSSQVPQYPSGGSVHYFRIGSGARIPLPISAAVAALANGSSVIGATKFIWDPVQNLVDIATDDGLALKLINVSPSGNLAVTQDTTTKDVNWDSTKVLGLFLI